MYGDTGRPDFEEEKLDDIAHATPEQFANLEAAKEQSHELWHGRLLKLLRRRDTSAG